MTGLAEASQISTSSLRSLKTWTPNNERFSLRGIFMVHYLLTINFMIKKETNQTNHYGHISEKSDTSSRKASGRSSAGDRRRPCYHRR
jgi:hypothetical protein